MTDFVVNKLTLTRKILSLITPEYSERQLEHSVATWWKNKRASGGLALTHKGDESFRLAGLEYFDISCPKQLLWQSDKLLKLDNYFVSPYYLIYPKNLIRVYDSRISILIGLHGDIVSYIDSLSLKREEI